MARRYVVHGPVPSARETALRLTRTPAEADELVAFAERTIDAVLVRDARRRPAPKPGPRRRKVAHAA